MGVPEQGEHAAALQDVQRITKVRPLFGDGRVGVADVTLEVDGKDELITYTMVLTNPYVSVLCYRRKGKRVFVLIQRTIRTAAGLVYDLCEGGIKPGYTPEQAIVKEAHDELGLQKPDILDLELFGYFYQMSDRGLQSPPIVGQKPDGKRSCVFLAKVRPTAELTETAQDDEETIESVWMDLDEVIEKVKAEAKITGAIPLLLMLLLELQIRKLSGEL